MPTPIKLIPCLWFDSEAEEAAKYYCGIFKNSKITKVTHYGEEGYEIHNRPAGSVMTVSFELDGNPFTGLNGGALFKFNEAISLEVHCENQEEVDYYWERLKTGGDEKAQACGWLKDKYGLSWQVFPESLNELVGDQTTPNGQRAMAAMLKMKKIDIEKIRQAYAGPA